MVDFNIDLQRVDVHTPTTKFVDVITVNLLVPHIIIPTRNTSTTRTLIDNIYSNLTDFKEGMSGKLTLAICDHLAQFLIIQEEAYKIQLTSNIYKRDCKIFDRVSFLLHLLAIDWDEVISIGNYNNPNESFNTFFKYNRLIA